MKRFNLWFSLVVLLSMGIGSYYAPDGSFFWLASVDIGAQMIRMGLILLVSVQLFTEPPRHIAIRLPTGATAIATAVWAVHVSTFMNTPVFDTVVLLQTAIALAISALELPDREFRETQVIAAETAYLRKV
jgi:hypothetical protein